MVLNILYSSKSSSSSCRCYMKLSGISCLGACSLTGRLRRSDAAAYSDETPVEIVAHLAGGESSDDVWPHVSSTTQLLTA